MTSDDIELLNQTLSTLRLHGYVAGLVELPLATGVLKLDLAPAPPEELSPMERKGLEEKSPGRRALESYGLKAREGSLT